MVSLLLGSVVSGTVLLVDDPEYLAELVNLEVGVLGEILVVMGAGDPDGDGAGRTGAEEVEEVVTHEQGFGRIDAEPAAEVSNAEGVRLGGAIFTSDDGVELQTVPGGDGFGVAFSVAGQDADVEATGPQAGERFGGAGIQLGGSDGPFFVVVEYSLGPAALLCGHGFHRLQDGPAVPVQPDFLPDGIEIKVRLGYCSIQIEYYSCYRHLLGALFRRSSKKTRKGPRQSVLNAPVHTLS
jgi:hypothetical protein